MKPIDETRQGQTETLAFVFDLPHAPAKVWRSLTEPALLSEWMLPVLDLQLEPGAPFTFRADPQPGWDGVVHCRILDVEPLRKISYTWAVGDALDTVVSFTLTATETGTHVLLVQSGFRPDQKRNFGGARYGWRVMGERLITLLARLTTGDTDSTSTAQEEQR
jgi:uncharacterized protein YndB with AHSA1/START domain